MYKGTTNANRVGNGTTADAIRHELATGQAVGGKFHMQKGQESMRALENWLKGNPNAAYRDRVVTGLIHMNGRVYDPAIARFLSVDPIVQESANPQAWNAYSYVLNNPLRYTDPSGYWFVAFVVNIVNIENVVRAVFSVAIGVSASSRRSERRVLGYSSIRIEVPGFGGQAIPQSGWGETSGDFAGVTSCFGNCDPGAQAALNELRRQGRILESAEPMEACQPGIAGPACERRGGPSWVQIGSFAVSFVPGVGDYIAFKAAYDDPDIYTISEAVVGVFGPLGDVAAKGIKVVRVARTAQAARDAARAIVPKPGTRVRPPGVPENWRIRASDSPGGTKYYDPSNRGNHVRVEQGNTNSPYPNSQNPYVREHRGGSYRDAAGNRVEHNDPAGHIPLDQYRGWPR